MKAVKVLLPVMIVACLSFSWWSLLSAMGKTKTEYADCLKAAESSYEEGLYEQAIEYYKEALSYDCNETTYNKIKEAYETLYEEEPTAPVRNHYIADMEDAASDFPKAEQFWTTQIKLYLDTQNYSKAYSTAKKAFNYGATGEELKALYRSLRYMTKEDYKLYYDYKALLNGYIAVCEGENWMVLDESGEQITGQYMLIGKINDEGKGIYVNDRDTRLLDKKEVARGRYAVVVEDAGYYDEASELVPVKTDGTWKYMNAKGEFLPGEFEIAGSFYDKQAVAYTGETWVLLDEKGEQEVLSKFEDIKLDLYGRYLQHGIVIAKEGGAYHFYDAKFKQIGDFSADETDICVDGTLVAFRSGEKWGYADTEGRVIIEPQYASAKSFSNGYAAVCSEKGLWGFLNDQYELVIDYSYLDAQYFNSKKTCLVSTTENTVQLLRFMFE